MLCCVLCCLVVSLCPMMSLNCTASYAALISHCVLYCPFCHSSVAYEFLSFQCVFCGAVISLFLMLSSFFTLSNDVVYSWTDTYLFRYANRLINVYRCILYMLSYYSIVSNTLFLFLSILCCLVILMCLMLSYHLTSFSSHLWQSGCQLNIRTCDDCKDIQAILSGWQESVWLVIVIFMAEASLFGSS